MCKVTNVHAGGDVPTGPEQRLRPALTATEVVGREMHGRHNALIWHSHIRLSEL